MKTIDIENDCARCGAPAEGDHCKYCGSSFGEDAIPAVVQAKQPTSSTWKRPGDGRVRLTAMGKFTVFVMAMGLLFFGNYFYKRYALHETRGTSGMLPNIEKPGIIIPMRNDIPAGVAWLGDGEPAMLGQSFGEDQFIFVTPKNESHVSNK